jgi:hypothetical protein
MTKESEKTSEQLAKEIYEAQDTLNKLLHEATRRPKIIVIDNFGKVRNDFLQISF